ncbi:MAG: hypothetical protein ACE5H3_04825 [Planctomycetota bacterium]
MTVAPITRAPLVPAFGHSRGMLPPGALDRLLLWDAGVHRLVFVDGRYAPELSSAVLRPRVRVESLAAALARDPAELERHLAGFSRHAAGNPFPGDTRGHGTARTPHTKF